MSAADENLAGADDSEERDSGDRDSGSGDSGSGGRPERSRKTVVGTVKSDCMQKTISVDVVRLERHGRYHKYLRRRTSYKAHDEREEAGIGDLVRIEETRPLSRTKRWRLVEVIRRSRGAAPAPSGTAAAAEGGAS